MGGRKRWTAWTWSGKLTFSNHFTFSQVESLFYRTLAFRHDSGHDMFEWGTGEEDTTRTLASCHNSGRDIFDGTGEDVTEMFSLLQKCQMETVWKKWT